MASKRPSRLLVIWIVIACDLAITASKLFGGLMSGSSALLSEAAHTSVDISIGLLLLYGEHRASVPADENHPLGHGREIYFWSFVVSLLMFSGGAVGTILLGVWRILQPEQLSDVWVAYVVLLAAGLFDATSLYYGWRRFNVERGEQSLAAAVVASKDAPTFVVLLQDTAGVLGVLIAAAGTFASAHFGWAKADGVASCAIGLLLAATALVLARESKRLLLGEPADPKIAATIRRVAERQQGGLGVDEVATLQVAPDQIVVMMELNFGGDLRPPQVEAVLKDIERKVKKAVPQVTEIFVHPTS